MDLTVSKPVKILALILVIAGVGGIASMSMMGKSSGASAGPQLSVDQIRARAHHTTTVPAKPAAKPPTTAKPAAAKPAAVTAKPKPATTVAAKPAAPPKPKVMVAKNGLPIALAQALRRFHIVVVSVFDPQSRTDSVSYAEARAGAGDANAGFFGVNVLDDNVAGPLTAALPGGGLLPLPGLLVYRAPGTLVERIDGFADRDAVAALALQAKTAPAFTGSASATTTAAPPAVAPAAALPAAAPTTTTP